MKRKLVIPTPDPLWEFRSILRLNRNKPLLTIMTIDSQTQIGPQLQPIVITDRSTILVIEDDDLQVELLEQGLTRNGFHVRAAATANLGFQIAQTESPDVILLDLGLPDSSGMKLCEKLADDPATSDIPIIVISGTTDKDVVKRTRNSGGKFFLHKPYDPNTVLLLINKAIDDRVSWY